MVVSELLTDVAAATSAVTCHLLTNNPDVGYILTTRATTSGVEYLHFTQVVMVNGRRLEVTVKPAFDE